MAATEQEQSPGGTWMVPLGIKYRNQMSSNWMDLADPHATAHSGPPCGDAVTVKEALGSRSQAPPMFALCWIHPHPGRQHNGLGRTSMLQVTSATPRVTDQGRPWSRRCLTGGHDVNNCASRHVRTHSPLHGTTSTE
ncbi:hypothetical protein V2G26_013003 [Clonostachys chloroleuca]